MSSQIDPLSWIIPTIISAIVAFIIVALNRFTRTSDSTISGTIEIKGLKEKLEGLGESMDKSFDRMKDDVDVHNATMGNRLDRIDEKLSVTSSKVDLHDYRIQQLEANKNGNRNGGAKSAV